MFQKKTKLYRYRTVYISGHFHDDIIFRVLFSRSLLHCKISNTQTLYPTLFAVRKVFLKIVKKWMLQIKKLDIFPQFRKFIDMWKKHPGFTVYIPLQIERYDFWWYFMNIYLMSTCIQQWNYSILCINLYSCARIFARFARASSS